MHISNPAQSRDISLSLRHTVMLWMSVEMWRLMTVDDNCLRGQWWRCGDSRVSGGEGSFPDCDVVMLVVDVPDKHNVSARKVGFWERITSEKGWRGDFEGVLPDPVECGAWVCQGGGESALKNHVVSFHHVLHRVWGPTGKACVMRVRNGISSTSKKDVFSSGNNSIMDFNSCQNFHGLCFKEGQVVQCKYVIGERAGKGEGGAHTSRICISSPTYHAH